MATPRCPGEIWVPCLEDSCDLKDLYASLKVLAAEPRKCQSERLRELMNHEDRRIALEAAKALAAREDQGALLHLRSTAFLAGDDAPWAMEAVLILTELGYPVSAVIKGIAAAAPHAEVRAAAAWGLGAIGCPIADFFPLFQDENQNVVSHAIIAASRRVLVQADTSVLIDLFGGGMPVAAVACEVLIRATTPDIRQLIEAANGPETRSSWAISCLSRLTPEKVRTSSEWESMGSCLKSTLERLWFWESNSPFAGAEASADLAILNRQMFPA
jgi:hypothetical protein